MLSSLVFGIRRYRRKRSATDSSNNRNPEQDPPYLQQKGELDASGNTVYEIDGQERQHELEGGTEIHEMATNFDGRIELSCEEHSSELRA